MRFDEVLAAWRDFFDREEIRFAVAGQLALHLFGVARTMPQIAFAVDAAARARVLAHAEAAGFRATYASSRCSVHHHPTERFGTIAFIYTSTPGRLMPWRVPVAHDVSLPVADPARLFALSEEDVAALDDAILRIDHKAWADWMEAIGPPPSLHETNSGTDEPFTL